MPRITPFLWFDDQAEEAAKFYVSIFPNSKVGDISRYSEAGPGPTGSVMVVPFELDGQPFIALNGGPRFPFTEAVSFAVTCDTQEQIDRYWTALTDGGEGSVCGWLKDRYGLSWQVVPSSIGRLMTDPDPSKSARVMDAVLQMRKPDLAALERAYQGESAT